LVEAASEAETVISSLRKIIELETGLWELQVLSQVHWQCGRATDSLLIVASIKQKW
jgi:hypothetical protein